MLVTVLDFRLRDFHGYNRATPRPFTCHVHHDPVRPRLEISGTPLEHRTTKSIVDIVVEQTTLEERRILFLRGGPP